MEHIKSQSGGKVVTDHKHGHETSDVNFRLIIGFGIFLAISGIVLHITLLGFYHVLDRWAEHLNAPADPMVVSQAPQHAAGPMASSTMTAETAKETAERLNRTFGGNANSPMLQIDDARDMSMMRKQQETQMAEYQWINKDTGAVRIPIERAIDLIAQRGLPNVPVPATPAQPGKNPANTRSPAKAAATAKPASQTVKQ